MLCVVQKPFKGNGEEFQRDQLVDAKQFRNADILVGQRYMRPATQDELESAYMADDVEQKPVPVRKTTGLKARRAKRRKA